MCERQSSSTGRARNRTGSEGKRDMNYQGIETRECKKSCLIQIRVEPMRKYRWKRQAESLGLTLSDLLIVAVEKFIQHNGQ